MGLDQYLNKKKYFFREEDKLKITMNGKAIKGLDSSKVNHISQEVFSWRKSNQIHKWFVDNIQNGKDDCGSYEVEKAEFEALLKAIKIALSDKEGAKKVLPTVPGFFFGNEEYDEYYWKDLKDTEAMLVKELENYDDEWRYEYSSSW
jgi:hypothetical protein